MKSVNLQAHIPDISCQEIYDQLCDFSRYASLCQSVRKVEVKPINAFQCHSNWEVDFQSGVLKWQELDTFESEALRLRFEQTVGDIEHFAGYWQVQAGLAGSVLEFRAEFDLGMPMLADMLDPVAQQAITDNISSIIDGLFPSRVYEVPQP